jgi:hypothetical protein
MLLHEVIGRQLRERLASAIAEPCEPGRVPHLEVAHHGAALDLHSRITFRQAICAVVQGARPSWRPGRRLRRFYKLIGEQVLNALWQSDAG